jgi:1,4-dihydroxy-2-naphthoate octaprenyltransferase
MEVVYKPFTIKAALQLTSPPSLVASITPVLVGAGAAVALSDQVAFSFDLRSLACFILMLLCAVLAQSAVNTLNDYQDFLAGTDTAETVLDDTDASIVYNSIDPKAALRFGVALCLTALVLGTVVALLSVWWLILLGLVGVAAVVFYSFGPKLSYLPLGELVSGLVMGGIITSSTYIAMTMSFSPLVLAIAVPPIATIAMIMLTNNTCDIGRDIEAGRKTLAIVLGYDNSRRLAVGLAILTLFWMALLAMLFWMIALAPVGIIALLGYNKIALIGRGPYTLENRRQMMGNVVSWCRLVNIWWAMGLLAAGLVGLWF